MHRVANLYADPFWFGTLHTQTRTTMCIYVHIHAYEFMHVCMHVCMYVYPTVEAYQLSC